MGAGVGNGAPPVPEQVEDARHDGAPGGAFFSESELPVVGSHGGPQATLGGYSPDPNRTPQVSTAEDPMGLSWSKAPTGLQR